MKERRRDPSEETSPGSERRLGERRDSFRLPVRLRVRRPGEAHFEEHTGDLGLGGVQVNLPHPPFGNEVEVSLLLPKEPKELLLRGEVVRVTGGGHQYNAHIQFGTLRTEEELAVARYLDDETTAS